MSTQSFITHIMSATAVYCSIKVLIALVFFIWDLPAGILVLVYQPIFNTTPSLDTIAFGILRFMAPADYVTPFLLFYCLFYMKGFARILLSLLFAMSIFMTYSRFVWVETLVALSLTAFRMSRGQLFGAMAVALLAFPVAAIYVPSIPLIEQRFSSHAASYSDSLRAEQYEALTADLGENLLFGHGMASFSFKVIRDPGTPYSYEMQWLAFVYQLGFVGLAFLLGLALFSCGPLFASINKESVSVLLIFWFSLLSGFANPSLLGRSAGVSFAFILCLGLFLREKPPRASVRPSQSIAVATP